MTLDASIKLSVAATLRKPLELAEAQDPLLLSRAVTLANGTGAGQGDRSFHDKRPLASGDSEELDVTTLVDAFGDAIGLARLKVLYVRNLSSTDSLRVGGAANDALGLFADDSDALELRPGGILLVTAPDADGVVVASDSKLLLAHGSQTAGPLEYEIVLIGASQ